MVNYFVVTWGWEKTMRGMDLLMVTVGAFCDAEMVMQKGDDASPVSSSS